MGWNMRYKLNMGYKKYKLCKGYKMDKEVEEVIGIQQGGRWKRGTSSRSTRRGKEDFLLPDVSTIIKLHYMCALSLA
jgi:hypothetical protein